MGNTNAILPPNQSGDGELDWDSLVGNLTDDELSRAYAEQEARYSGNVDLTDLVAPTNLENTETTAPTENTIQFEKKSESPLEMQIPILYDLYRKGMAMYLSFNKDEDSEDAEDVGFLDKFDNEFQARQIIEEILRFIALFDREDFESVDIENRQITNLFEFLERSKNLQIVTSFISGPKTIRALYEAINKGDCINFGDREVRPRETVFLFINEDSESIEIYNITHDEKGNMLSRDYLELQVIPIDDEGIGITYTKCITKPSKKGVVIDVQELGIFFKDSLETVVPVATAYSTKSRKNKKGGYLSFIYDPETGKYIKDEEVE